MWIEIFFEISDVAKATTHLEAIYEIWYAELGFFEPIVVARGGTLGNSVRAECTAVRRRDR